MIAAAAMAIAVAATVSPSGPDARRAMDREMASTSATLDAAARM